jgi:hypothetical protein
MPFVTPGRVMALKPGDTKMKTRSELEAEWDRDAGKFARDAGKQAKHRNKFLACVAILVLAILLWPQSQHDCAHIIARAVIADNIPLVPGVSVQQFATNLCAYPGVQAALSPAMLAAIDREPLIFNQVLNAGISQLMR